MKKLRASLTILFFSMMMASMTSCLVTAHTDNGRHRGLFHRHTVVQQRSAAVVVYDNDNGRHRDKHKANKHRGHGNH